MLLTIEDTIILEPHDLDDVCFKLLAAMKARYLSKVRELARVGSSMLFRSFQTREFASHFSLVRSKCSNGLSSTAMEPYSATLELALLSSDQPSAQFWTLPF